jgi:hypothetical protein
VSGRFTTTATLAPGTPPLLVYADEIRTLLTDSLLHGAMVVEQDAHGVWVRVPPHKVEPVPGSES